MFFGGALFDSAKLIPTVIGFIAFNFCASCIYVMNDIKDVQKDRCHPIKCKRPVASGNISVKSALVLFGILLLSVVTIFCLFWLGTKAALWLVVYFIINVGYSFGLKNIPVLDITILSSGFLIRLIYGGNIAGVEISSWLYLTVIAFAFYMGLGKRLNELRAVVSSETRKVMDSYSNNYLNMNMYMCLVLGLVFYSLWTLDRSNQLLWTVPIVLVICLKYNLILENDAEKYGDPVTTLMHHQSLVVLVFCYVFLLFKILYF